MGEPTFSTKRISSELLKEIAEALRDKFYGSVEIYIQDSRVTQITERVIKKFSSQRNNSIQSNRKDTR